MRREIQEEIKHVIYTSRPTHYDHSVLENILEKSRINNVNSDVTGNLICHSDLFLQLLEGPPKAIDNLYQKILADNRHTDIVKLCDEPSKRRLFTSWAMKNDGYQSWILSRSELNELNSEDALYVFERLAREADQFL
jgi:hypothetical protein